MRSRFFCCDAQWAHSSPRNMKLEAGQRCPAFFHVAIGGDQAAEGSRDWESADDSAKIQSWKRRSARPRSAERLATK